MKKTLIYIKKNKCHHWQHATVTCQVRTRSAFYDRTSNAPHLLLHTTGFFLYITSITSIVTPLFPPPSHPR